MPQDELIGIVAEDLRFLREDWDEDVDDNSLRRSSTVLRRLLVDNELQRAWKAAGFAREPLITSSTLTPILSTIPKKRIIFASAGGAKYKNIEMRGALMTNYAMPRSEVASQHALGVPEETVRLSRFIQTPCFVVEGREISRRALIQYVTNKLGGAHWDPKRRKTEKERLFSLLDKASKQLKILGKNAVYFEILSCGQALARAEDIARFCARASQQ